MKKLLLTGATGAYGSELLPLLAERGYEVTCLVRAANKTEALRRIRRICNHPNIRAIRGDITETRCGISDHDRELLRHNVDRIFHCAASISFEDEHATHLTNIEGVRNVLELADILNVEWFDHVSTAYVAGSAPTLTEDESPSSPSLLHYSPNNYYELTKRVGETLVRAWGLHREDRRFAIYRPSILVGREDGTTPTFDAFYGYFLPLHRAAEAMRARAKAGKPLPFDVRVERNGTVHAPFVIQASSTATLSMTHIDWAARMNVELLEALSRSRTFHLVHPTPPLVRWVIDVSLRHLKIVGMRVVETNEEKCRALEEQSPEFRRMFQRGVDRILNQYRPYTNHDVHFAMEETIATLGRRFREPKKFDVAWIEKALDYAIATSWGEKTPEKVSA